MKHKDFFQQNGYVVVDDIIPVRLQEDIKNTLYSTTFPWNYVEDITYGPHAQFKSPGFSHLFRKEQTTLSQYYAMVAPIAYIGADVVGYEWDDVCQARSFLQLPLNQEIISKRKDILHIDLPFKHLVILYYVNDSDGETYIVNRKRNNIHEFNLDPDDYQCLSTVEPKQGRVLIFDGDWFHTARQPKLNRRCVINFNLAKREDILCLSQM